MRTGLLWVVVVSGQSLLAQGYGQNTGGTSGFGGSYGGGGAGGGAALARVAVAPGGYGGASGAGSGLAGSTQGAGASGGGGLHGVTRWTPMAEPNAIAGQFFSSGGVSFPGAAGFTPGGGRQGGYGVARSTNPSDPRLLRNRRLAQTKAAEPPASISRGTVASWTTASPAGLPARGDFRASAGVVPAPASAAATATLTAAQMAGVQPSD